MVTSLTRPSRSMAKTAMGWRPGWAHWSQFAWILRCTAAMYHANGKSDAVTVTAPAPCGEPVRWPSDGAGTSAVTGLAFVTLGLGTGGAALATCGSSLSDG